MVVLLLIFAILIFGLGMVLKALGITSGVLFGIGAGILLLVVAVEKYIYHK